MKVYIGIDWSENKHDVCFLDELGEVLRVQQIPHTITGFRQLDQARQSLGVGRQEVIIGLETAHNLLVDYLWDQGYEQIYVLPPSAVKSAQKRFRQSGAKDDAWDARLIADLLRTDRQRYAPWKPDEPLTRQIRAEVRFARQLGREIVQNGNRLRSMLLRYYPAALDAFPHLDSLVCLAFVQVYPTLQQAQVLSFEQLQTFLREHHHTQVRSWPTIYAALHSEHPRSNPQLDAAYASLAKAQAKILELLIRSRSECLARLGKLFLLHPDREIYDSLPQAGALLAPALLAKLGDTCTALRLVQCRCDRVRYPTPAVLQAPAHLRSVVANILMSTSARPATMTSAISYNNGPASPWMSRPGQPPPSVPTAEPTMMRFDAWPTAGWRFCGDCGWTGNPMMKLFT